MPLAVDQLSPPNHSEYDNLRVASSFAHSRMCGDAYASSVSSRGPMRSYFFLARPSGVAAASVTSPLTIRDWLNKGAKVPKVTLVNADEVSSNVENSHVVRGQRERQDIGTG